MTKKQKARLYVSDLVEDPAICYPAYYLLSSHQHHNEMLQSAIIDLHTYNFEHYQTPQHFDALFNMVESGGFAIFKEKYAVGYFGQKLMYLESHGWRTMPVTKETMMLENWLIT